ncbi:putative ABC transporter ATP-binding protein [bioreactor metagenome]|uniref:Putative ABC transporter ATP-binding protein n=1 Tax=bioreactor metagenome TaxID=1076179 RepID=A0A645AJ21_9ZZZZ
MLKHLRKQVGENKRPTFLTILFVVLEVVMDVTIPFLMAFLLDRGIDAGNLSEIIKWGALLLFCASIALLFGVLAGHFAARASTGFAKNVRRGLYYAVQDFSFANIDRFSTSSLVTRLTTDVTNVQHAYQMLTRIAVRSPVMLVFSFFMAFSINNSLSLVYLVAIPLLAVGLFFLIRAAYPIFTRVFKTYDKLNTVVQENIRAVRVVKSFVREQYEIKKFGSVSQEIFQDFSKAEKIVAFNSPLMQGTMYLCILAISYLGARLIVSSSMTTGQLMSFITYTSQILMSLMMLSMVFVMLTISKASAQRIEEVLGEKLDLVEQASPKTFMKDGSVTFEHVDFSYTKTEDKRCLFDVNLDIPSGCTVGILGPTGSAKTSLVQLIPRLYDVDNGSVKVGGEDVRSYSLESLRKEVGMVLQKNVLFSGTIEENLRWGNEDASEEELGWACRIAQAESFINSFPLGYKTYLEQDGSNLSGGQKQRLCIARALLKRPKILILDDTTSAVDTKTDSKIREALKTELKETTKLIIAQRISSVMDSDLIIMLDDGKIQAMGTHEELLATCPRYNHMFERQMRKEEQA